MITDSNTKVSSLHCLFHLVNLDILETLSILDRVFADNQLVGKTKPEQKKKID